MKKITVLFAILLLGSMVSVFAQTAIKGKVTDSKDASPVGGATIKVRGENTSTTSKPDGTFEIIAKQGSSFDVTEVSHISQIVKYSGGYFEIKMEQDAKGLSEVVVTALGIKREKRNLTYSAQEVKGESIINAKQDNIINALSGKVPGVAITNSTGMPGSSSRVVIRGATSLTGENQALFIIDGVPFDNTEAGSIDGALSQGGTSNRAIDIDPNTIESVTVLKGSAATALYGSSAARGVILITTKSGKKGQKAIVGISSSVSWDNAILPGFQDKYAQGIDGNYVDGNNGAKGSASWGPLIDTLKVNGKPVEKHNPRKEFFRTGHTFDNSVNVSGSGEKSKYFFSYSNLVNNGIVPTTNFKRHSIFVKVNNQVSDKINVGFQLNYVVSENNRTAEGNGLGNPLWTVYGAPISWNPKPTTYADGTQQLYRAARNNPYWLLDNTGFVSKVNRFLPIASVTYTPLSWLTVTERLGADMYTDQSDLHEAKGIVGSASEEGRVVNRRQLFRQYNNDIIIEARKQFTNDLFTSFVLGNNIFAQTSEYSTGTGLGLGVDDFFNIGSAKTQSYSNTSSQYRKVGTYLQANIEYKKMLILGLTGRVDATSTLAKNNNTYPYGSAALGFIFSELIKPNNTLGFGKFRISYSSVGSDNVGPYSLTTPFSSATVGNIVFPFQGQSGFLLNSTLGNSKLVNESLKEFETGLDLKFFKNRLNLEASYFTRKSASLIAPIQIDPATGSTNVFLNVATIQNKGFELLLSGTPVQSKDFLWEVAFNFTKIKNMVLDLGPGLDLYQFGGFSGGGGVYAFKGQPYGILYGSKYKRNAAGQKLVRDDGRPIIADDLGAIGDINPDFTAGITNTITFNGLSLSFLFDMKKGGDIFNFDEHYNWFYGTPKTTEDRSDRLIDGIRESDGKVNAAKISAQTYFRDLSAIDEAVIEDGTYVKLRNLSLSYNLKKSILKKLPLKSLSLTATGNNLWIYKPHFYGSDPEASLQSSGNGQGIVNYMTPTTRSFSIGLKATF
jgi:TonB-linked SusC/RagA family outer membrane protein